MMTKGRSCHSLFPASVTYTHSKRGQEIEGQKESASWNANLLAYSRYTED